MVFACYMAAAESLYWKANIVNSRRIEMSVVLFQKPVPNLIHVVWM